MKCDNFERNCTWVGTVGTVKDHVTTCQYALLPCPKQCQDGGNEICHFMRRDLDDHVKKNCPNREHTCDFCAEKGTFATITQVHNSVCPKMIVTCESFGCEGIMPREHLQDHMKYECEYTVVSCKHKSIGCDAKLARRYMAAHEEDDMIHLGVAINTISLLKENSMVLQQGESMVFRMMDYQMKKRTSTSFVSPSFYTSDGYHMAIEVFADGHHGTFISIHAPIIEGKYDSKLQWPFLGDVVFTLLNQVEDKNHHSGTLNLIEKDNVKVGDNWGLLEFIPHSQLGHNPVKKTQYLKDDTLYFRVSVTSKNRKPWLECTVIA